MKESKQRRAIAAGGMLWALPDLTANQVRLIQGMRWEAGGAPIGGVNLAPVPLAPKWKDAATGVPYLRRLAYLRIQAKRGKPLFPERPVPSLPTLAAALPRLEPESAFLAGGLVRSRLGDRDLASLRTCRCARCGVELLGPKDEHLRRELKEMFRPGSMQKQLPGPVAAWAAGRPYCTQCLDLPVVQVG